MPVTLIISSHSLVGPFLGLFWSSQRWRANLTICLSFGHLQPPMFAWWFWNPNGLPGLPSCFSFLKGFFDSSQFVSYINAVSGSMQITRCTLVATFLEFKTQLYPSGWMPGGCEVSLRSSLPSAGFTVITISGWQLKAPAQVEGKLQFMVCWSWFLHGYIYAPLRFTVRGFFVVPSWFMAEQIQLALVGFCYSSLVHFFQVTPWSYILS